MSLLDTHSAPEAGEIRVDEAVLSSEGRYRFFVDNIRDVVFQTDARGRFTFLNAAWTVLTGYRVEESLGRLAQAFVYPEDRRLNVTRFRELVERKDVAPRYVMRYQTKDNEVRWFAVKVRLLHNTQGRIIGTFGSLSEITDNRIAGGKFRKLLETVPDAIVIVNRDYKIDFINTKTKTLFGYDRSELLNEPVDRLVSTRFRDALRDHLTHYFLHPEAQPIDAGLELDALCKDGCEFPAEISLNPLEISEGVLITAMIRDVTERKQAETSMMDMAMLLNHAQDAIWVLDSEGRITYWNRGAERLYGWSEDAARGRMVRDFLFEFDEYLLDTISDKLRIKGVWRGEMHRKTDTGRRITVESSWTHVQQNDSDLTFIVDTDVTEKKALLEEQFLRQQRLESLGTLTGGVAHDLNNMLNPILLSLEWLGMNMQDEKQKSLLTTLETSVKHGANLLRQLLSFAKGAEDNFTILPVKPTLYTIEEIMHQTLPPSIQTKLEVDQDLWAITGDSTQLHQVLMNLCVNARDAMSSSGGLLKLSARNCEIKTKLHGYRQEIPEGNYVVISISDTGTGMSPEVLDKVFDSFYTTKETGTGLGLSTTLQIIERHGGFIDVLSEPGQGTCFDIYLPAYTQEEVLTPAVFDYTSLSRPSQGETILVVDDVITSLEVMKSVLEINNYRVLIAQNGAEALKIFDENEIDVVITDIMMPVMDGFVLISELDKRQASDKIVGVSGLRGAGDVLETTGVRLHRFLSKPFTAQTLMGTIADVLYASD